MKVEITSKNLELTPSLTAYVNEKVGMLHKHVQKFELEGDLLVRVRVGRISAHHHKGEVFEATADLALPGAHLRAEKANEDVHVAVDQVRDMLAQEIEKYKSTHSTHD